MPLRDGAVDLVFCVSTLEHVGQDNRLYGGDAESDAGAQEQALLELRRVLDSVGRLLLTVPCGRREQHGWFAQRSVDEWRALFEGAGFRVSEHEVYELSAGGWSRGFLATGARYGARAPGASAVLCAELRPG